MTRWALALLLLGGCRSHYRPVLSFELDEGGGCATLAVEGEYCWGTRAADHSIKPTRSKQAAVAKPARFTLDGARVCDQKASPARCQSLPEAPVSFAAGANHACAVDPPGRVHCLGDADKGRLGGAPTGEGQWVHVAGVSGAKKVVVTNDGACVLLGDATVSCWGDNGKFSLAQAEQRVYEPSPIVGLFAITGLGAAGDQVCASLTDGGLRCWGSVAGEGASIGRPGGFNNVPMPVLFP